MAHIPAMPDRYGGDRNFVCCAQLRERILTFFVVGCIADGPSPEIRHFSGSGQGFFRHFHQNHFRKSNKQHFLFSQVLICLNENTDVFVSACEYRSPTCGALSQKSPCSFRSYLSGYTWASGCYAQQQSERNRRAHESLWWMMSRRFH